MSFEADSFATQTPCPRCLATGHELNQQALGKKLRLMRDHAQISQGAMALKLEVAHGFLSDLENGKRKWNAELVEKFIAACATRPSAEPVATG